MKFENHQLKDMWQFVSLLSLILIFQLGIPKVVATSTCPSLEPERVAYYPLDGEHQFREVQDRTLPLAITGNPILSPGPDGNPDGSYSFSGVDALSTLNSPVGALNVQSSITVLCWVTIYPTNPIQYIVRFREIGTGFPVFFFFYQPSASLLSWIVYPLNGFPVTLSIQNVPTFSWILIGASYDGATGETFIFLDGAVIAYGNVPPNIPFETLDTFLEIGSSFVGEIAQVRVYDVALSELQVADVFLHTVSPCESETVSCGEGSPSPSAIINCGVNGTHMIKITINDVPDLPEWIAAGEEDEWRLNGGDAGACGSSLSGCNATYGPFFGSDCANITSTTDYLIYTFQIRAEVNGDSPTRRYDHNYIITCNYGRNGDVFSTFLPLHKLEGVHVGATNFTFIMQLFRDDDHTQLITGTVYLNEIIYVKVGVAHEFGEQIDLLLEHCYASSDEDGNNDRHDLIENSCDTGNDSTLSYSCENQTGASEEFFLRAFRYAGAEPGDPRSSVWFHCEVYACLSANSSSLCQGLCDSGCSSSFRRRRRDAGLLQGDVYEQKVSAGPIRFVEREQREQDIKLEESDPPDKFPAKLTILISVSGIVAMVIICVTVFLVIHMRRRTVRVTEIPVTATENPVCEAADFHSKI